MAKLNIVGVGPGAPEYVTPIARDAVQNAQVVVGAERSLNLLRNDIKGEALKLTAQNLDDALRYAVDSVKKGKTVAILSTGDPCFAGLLRTFLKSPFINEVEVDIVPGISSVQVCAARLRLCWDNIDLISFHEGVIPEKKEQLAELIKKGKTVFVLPDPKTFTPRDIVMFLIKSGIDKATQVAICENLTLSNERIIQTTLGEAAKIDTSSLSVMVIKAKLEE